jgi:alkanesulfonate monooxygenase
MVALNPLYTHPFAAARSLLSIVKLYDRPVDLNLITGAALSELAAVRDTLDHKDRYMRLREYVQLFLLLLEGKPVTWDGRYYRTSGLQLPSPMAVEMYPRLYLAGASGDARQVAGELGATMMGMLPPAVHDMPDGLGAVHLGVLTRKSATAAEKAAKDHFPDDHRGRRLLGMSLGNTDSVWRRNLAGMKQDDGRTPFRSNPFLSFKADTPYLVGDYETVAHCITDMIKAGVHTFVCDMPTRPVEFSNLAVVIELVRSGKD